jgi:hypothetical protein
VKWLLLVLGVLLIGAAIWGLVYLYVELGDL